MTNKEAISYLRRYGYFIAHDSSKVEEAVKMAIKVLEQEPCEDAISRQDAIEAVKHAWGKGLEPTQFLEELTLVSPARPTGKWNPVSERLPKEYGNYIVSIDDGSVYGDVDIGTFDDKDKRWSGCNADGFYWLNKVIAWMPLPEPYVIDKETPT